MSINTQTTGKFALDSELHNSEPLTNVRTMPVEQRQAYQHELDRLAAEKQQLRQAIRRLSKEERAKTDVMTGFSKPGGGAPLRDSTGAKVTATSKMRPKDDTHLMNVSKHF